jgi:hypothetical protein
MLGASNLAVLIETLHLGPVHLVGNSYGGSIALGVAWSVVRCGSLLATSYNGRQRITTLRSDRGWVPLGMTVLVILVVLAIIFGIGAVIEGLLWMFLIGAALLVAAIWFGWSKLRSTNRA